MMPLAERLTFTVPLSGADFKLAQKFSCEQKDADKSKQVFLNTLAVLAVNFYCQCLKVETNLEESIIGHWHYNRRILMDSADLKIDVLGKLECRPVLPNENICYVPSEVWSDRVGYVVVEIDEEAKKAILFGFVEQIETNELPLAQLPDIDNLVDLLLLAKNKQFFERIFAKNYWNEDESAEILKDKQKKLVRRDSPALPTIDKSITSPLYKAKYITLKRRTFILLVRITPTKEGKFQLLVEVESSKKIPSDLNLKLLSLSDQTLKANPTKGDHYISLEYTLQLGESFQIQVKRAEESHTEQFSFD